MSENQTNVFLHLCPRPRGGFFHPDNYAVFSLKSPLASKFDLVTKKQATKGCLFLCLRSYSVWARLVSLGYGQRNLAIFPINVENLKILPLIEGKDLLGVNVAPFAQFRNVHQSFHRW